MKTTLACSAVIATSLFGCSPGDNQQPSSLATTEVDAGVIVEPDVPPPEPLADPTFYPSMANGEIPPGGGAMPGFHVFPTSEDIYLDAVSGNRPFPWELGVPGPAVRAGDYYFAVTDGFGRLVSTDDLSCRRIHVNALGLIDQVYAGASGCVHAQSLDVSPYAKGGGITVQLVPFAVSPVIYGPANQIMYSYRLRLERVEEFDGVVDAVDIDIWVLFPDVCGDGLVHPSLETCDDGNVLDDDGCPSTCDVEVPDPVCGNGTVESGEACDDGNTSGQDGCTASCEVEHLCCCGNGDIEPGEQCDDGNGHDGDGCDAGCQVE